ncbi:MAG: DUF4249 domain-containing protein [Chitinophagaceae bacterium]|nr:DUF4249 domain-containing protein [Chitinophagaceae bacterium]
MKTPFLFTLLLSQWFILSCTKDAELATPAKQIVVDAQISPTDDTIRVILMYSSPVNSVNAIRSVNGTYDPENEFEGASVTLSDGRAAVALERDAQRGYFKIAQTDFPLSPGSTYFLNVRNVNDSEVTASTTVPYPVENAVYTVLNYQQDNTQYVTRYASRFSFTDTNNNPKYYRLYAGLTSSRVELERLFGNRLEAGKDTSKRFDIVVERSIPYLLEPDDLITGQSGYFISCSSEYFDYYTSISNVDGLSNTPEFLVEPVNIYSNIKGGLGIFAAYNLLRVAP